MKRRNNFISRQLEETAGSSTAAKIKKTAVLLKGFDECERTKILEVANVGQAEINAEEMVALKAVMGIPWEKNENNGKVYMFNEEIFTSI